MVKNLEWDPGFPVLKLQPFSWQEFSILHWNWLLSFPFQKACSPGRKRPVTHPQGAGPASSGTGGKLPDFVFLCFAACTWVQISGISDMPHWTSTLQDSNPFYLKRMHPLSFKKGKKIKEKKKEKYKIILKQPRQRFCDLQEEVYKFINRIINRAKCTLSLKFKILASTMAGNLKEVI